jgi:hypothetical protein
MWERELRKLKGLYDNRLRASQQKSSKMEQALTNQTYQVMTSFICASRSSFYHIFFEDLTLLIAIKKVL